MFVKISRIFKIRELWFVSDRVNKADDNGEHFFKYLKKNFPNKNLYFVISSSSPDYNRMKKIGKVIDPSSLKYKFIINIADYIVSSHAENYIFNPLGRMGSYIRDQYEFKYIFLQHGITKDYLKQLDDSVKQGFRNTIKEAKQYIEGCYEDKLINSPNSPIGTIFTLKNNYNWKDKQEIEQTNKTISVELED